MRVDEELDTPERRMQSEMLKGEAIRFAEGGGRDPARADRYKRIEAFIEAQKSQAAVAELGVFVETRDHKFDASLATTGDGRNFLRLNQKDLRQALASDAATDGYLGLIGHEFSHLRNRDNSPEVAARRQGDNPAQLAMEMRSDIEGAGPTGSGKPEARAARFRADLADAVAEYNKENPPIANPTPADLRRMAEWERAKHGDTDHPNHFDRLSAMEAEASLMHGKKQMAARTGNADSPAEQSKWLMDKLMEQYKDGTLPEPASLRSAPAPAAELPEGVKKQVGDMGKLPMAVATDTPTTSAPTPAVVKDEQPAQVK